MRLYSAKPAFGVRCASPFATKAESMLRLSGVDYERVDVSPMTGPRKKLPYLQLEDGTVISDSRNIQRHLEEHHHLHLSSCAYDTATLRLVEEHLYWVQVYFRWTHHPDRVHDELFDDVPWPLRALVFAMVRRQVRRDLWGQGLGRRPESEILELAQEDLRALEQAIGDGRFLGGEELSAADCAAHGLLDQVLSADLDDAFAGCVRERPVFVRYHQRVNDAIWGARSRTVPLSEAS